jgi:LysM repeat protein
MMKPVFKKVLSIIVLLTALLGVYLAAPGGVHAQAGTPAEMHQAINNLRAANGLPPLNVNNTLMQSAQNHANWIAAGNPGGHTGEGGSSAQDRAIAVGYGEGKTVFVTENWARGVNLSVSSCIYDMWNDAAHMNNMLTTRHNEFGAGTALDGQGMTVYVVNFGHVSGSAPQPTYTPDSAPADGATTDGATTEAGSTATPPGPTKTPVPLIQPVVSATPNPDGSVIHVVQFGQSLSPISEAYGISMADLMAQNNLTEESIIYEGQELLIVPANQETQETPEGTGTPEGAAPTAAPSPTFTPTQRPTSTQQAPTDTRTPEPQNSFMANIFSGETLWVGIGLVAVSVFGIALLLFTAARLR